MVLPEHCQDCWKLYLETKHCLLADMLGYLRAEPQTVFDGTVLQHSVHRLQCSLRSGMKHILQFFMPAKQQCVHRLSTSSSIPCKTSEMELADCALSLVA